MMAVLFDFNGTLYNDTQFHIQAWGNFIKKHLGLELTEAEIRRRCIGPGNWDILRGLFGDDISWERMRELSELKETEYRAAARKNLQLKKGAPEFMDYLTNAGIPFALATASPIGNVEFYLHELGLEKWFTLERIVYDDGTIKGKPDPAFYIEAARRLGTEPQDCLVCEDSLTGIQSAQRARAGRIVVLEGTLPPEKLAKLEGIHAVVPDFCGMEKYLR